MIRGEPLEVQRIAAAASERERRVMEAIEASGLRPASDFAFRYPHELSGGQRQRGRDRRRAPCSVRRSWLPETVSMLDVSIRTEILKLLLDLRTAHGLT